MVSLKDIKFQGLHGVGVSVVNALGEWLEVEVVRDGKRYTNSYHHGKPKSLMGVTEPVKMVKRVPLYVLSLTEIFDDIIFTQEVIDHRLES